MNQYQKTGLLVGLQLCLFTLCFAQNIASPVLPKSKHGLVVIAHRGSHVHYPENSITSIEDAIRLGADYVELDVRTSKDGYLVLNHNETVDARSNGKGAVRDLSWIELQTFQLSSKDGEVYRFPSLEEALQVCKNRINIYLDFKDADVSQTYALLKKTGMEKQVLVYLNDSKSYLEWRRVAPQMPLMSRLPSDVLSKEALSNFQKEVSFQVVENKVQDGKQLAVINEAGIAVFLDAQRKDEGPETWAPLIQLGVQGLQTDQPEALINYLKKNKLRDGATVRPIAIIKN